MSTVTELKAKGNELFSKQFFKQAIEVYSEAIGLMGEPSTLSPSELDAWVALHSNRSASHLSVEDFNEALLNTDQCIKWKPRWAKGHFRRAAALFQLGRVHDAIRSQESGLVLEPSNNEMKQTLRDMETFKSDGAKFESFIPSGPPPSLVSSCDCECSSPTCATKGLTDDIPSPEKQREAVGEIIASAAKWLQHPAAPRKYRKGECYFILSKGWWTKWNNFECASGSHPGAIDNSSLMEEVDSSSRAHLKRGLAEHADFVVLPHEIWHRLYQWYGGGPVLPREVHLGGIARNIPFLCLYPIAVSCCLHCIKHSASSATTSTLSIPRWTVVSETLTLKELLYALCALLYPCPPHRSRLWRIRPGPVRVFAPAQHALPLRECGIRDGAIFVVQTDEDPTSAVSPAMVTQMMGKASR